MVSGVQYRYFVALINGSLYAGWPLFLIALIEPEHNEH